MGCEVEVFLGELGHVGSFGEVARIDPADRPNRRPIDRFDSPARRRSQTSTTSTSVNLGTTTTSDKKPTLSPRCCVHALRRQALCAVRDTRIGAHISAVSAERVRGLWRRGDTSLLRVVFYFGWFEWLSAVHGDRSRYFFTGRRRERSVVGDLVPIDSQARSIRWHE